MRVSATYEASRPMLKWTIREPVWMKMAVDHGNSVMISISGTTGDCVKIHKKPVEGESFLKTDDGRVPAHLQNSPPFTRRGKNYLFTKVVCCGETVL